MTPTATFPARRLILAALPLALLASAGCRTTESITLPATPSQWRATLPSSVEAGPGTEVVISAPDTAAAQGPVRLVAGGFTWANSEIEFKLYDPGQSEFNIAFYDQTFLKVRHANASRWFETSNQRALPMSKSANLWQLDRVHELWLGGEQPLLDKGYYALGGFITIDMGNRGVPKNQPAAVFSESFKMKEWNDIRVRFRDGKLTVWVNGDESQTVQTDRRLDGEFGFEVYTGKIRLSDIKLRKL